MSLIMLGPTTTEPAPFRGTRSASASTSLPCALPQVASPPDDRGTMFRPPLQAGPLCSLSILRRNIDPPSPPPPILELWLPFRGLCRIHANHNSKIDESGGVAGGDEQSDAGGT